MEVKLKKTLQEKNMDVNFLPWVGIDYNNQKKKILILGESHYDDIVEVDYVTEGVVSRFLVGQIKLPFFENITKAFLGKQILNYPFESEVIKFWQSVAFYNFIQKPVRKSNTIPSPELIKAAQLPFSHILKTLKPDILLCVSVRLYEEWIPDKILDLQIDGKYAGQLNSDKFKSRATWYYKINSNRFTFISRLKKHPSRWKGKDGEENLNDSSELIKKLREDNKLITTVDEYDKL